MNSWHLPFPFLLDRLFEKPVHFTMDNHFSGDNVIRLLGEKGYGATMTTRRNRLCTEVPNKYFHHKKEAVTARSKAARFEHPIVAVKTARHPEGSTAKDYRVVITSFQSTGSTNITTLNALNKCSLYVVEKQRGRGASKRKWGIEMNEARELYLSTYSTVDKIDQMLRAWQFKILTWKWWHHAGMHGGAIGFCMAYEFYKECTQGNVDPDWKVDDPMTGPEFRARMLEQMLEYDPRRLHYPGDSKLRSVTRINRKRRGKVTTTANNTVCEDGQLRVGFPDYLNEMRPRGRGEVTRFAIHSSEVLKKHLKSMKQVSEAKCEVCSNKTFWRCDLCNGARMCLKSGSGASTLSCVLDYHSEDHMGLTREDRHRFFGEKKSTFTGVKAAELKRNRVHIDGLRKRMLDGGEDA